MLHSANTNNLVLCLPAGEWASCVLPPAVSPLLKQSISSSRAFPAACPVWKTTTFKISWSYSSEMIQSWLKMALVTNQLNFHIHLHLADIEKEKEKKLEMWELNNQWLRENFSERYNLMMTLSPIMLLFAALWLSAFQGAEIWTKCDLGCSEFLSDGTQ